MHIAEVVTIAKSLPLLRLNTYKSLILSYSADYRRIFLKKCCGIKDNTIILQIFFNMNKNAIMSRLIEYSNNILFFDVMFGETLNEETRCSKCVHPFLRI